MGGTVGQIHTLDDAPIVREVRGLVGELSADEAALVRALTPAELSRTITVEHLFDLVDLLVTMRADESVADYIYAVAPIWDGAIETLVLAAKVSTMLTDMQLERGVPAGV
jgi:hypothetical protein